MKITLEIVRETLRRALGAESYVASFITNTTEDSNIATAAISEEGRLRYNPDFVAQYVESPEDLFSLLFHELLHPLFGHFLHGVGRIENLAADAVINAVVATVYNPESRGGALFRRFYADHGLEGLLRPGSRMGSSRYDRVYSRLYGSGSTQAGPFSTGELIQTLKILTPREENREVVLIGRHDEAEDSAAQGTLLPSTVPARIAEDIRRSLQERDTRGAGFSASVVPLLMEALRTHLSIRKALLQRFLTRRKVDHFRETLQERRVTVSPIPIAPSKRDLVLVAAGAPTFHFRNRVVHAKRANNRGLALYLDVSGSVLESLPKILGVLRNLRRDITSVFVFSNRVVETPFENLLAGQIQTTWGTDFNCIAESILERGFEKAVIMTDGIAHMGEELGEKLAARKIRTLTILFGGVTKCKAFERFGEVVRLEDVTQ